ncbi:unnamed protein product [Closterium sp. NIES-53]
MLALCREHRLEHRTKHIALRYFLARELQQRGQLRLAYVASQANTADIFTKALQPCDHQRFCTMLACFALLCLTGLAPRPLGLSAAAVTAAAATAAPACCATMASLRVLAFDHEGRPVQFDTWLDDLQLYLLTDSKDSVSLFDLASGGATAPPATADSATRSQWLTRDAAARLAICNHLPLAKCAHFGQHRPCTTLDHFLSLDPTSLTVDLLEQHLLAAETSAAAVGAARGTPRPPFFEGCSPSPLAPSYASAAAADISVAEDVGAASASAKRRSSKGKGGRGGGGGSDGRGGGSGSGGGGSSGGSGGSGRGGDGRTSGGSGGSDGGGGGSGGSGGSGGGGTGGSRTGPRHGRPGGGQRQQQQRRSKTQSPQQLRVRAGQTCGKLHTQHRCFFGDDIELPRWADPLRSRIAIFDLDFDAILSAMYALSVSAEGDCYWCVPPDPGIAAAALGASESSTLPGTATAPALHTFTVDSGASRYFFCDTTTLTPLPVRLADPSGGPLVARSSTVLPCLAVPSGSLSGLHLPSFSTNLVSNSTLQDAMVTTTTPGGSRLLLVSPPVAPDSFVAPPPGSPLPATPSWHELPSSRLWSTQVSASPPTLACPALPSDLPVLRLHFDRVGEFSSNLLRDFCHGEGILQTFTLPESPQKNGIPEHRIGLVMEVACTSMIHAVAPHFLWTFAVRYAAHQLNIWPCVSLPETSPTLRWTGEVGDASVFRVGTRAFVCDMSADKLSARAIPCVFLGFVLEAPGWQFYHPTLHRVLPSQDIMFDESVPFYLLFPYHSAPPPPPPLFLAPGPPPVDPLPPQGPAPSGVSQVEPLHGTAPVEVAVGSGAALGAASGGAAFGVAEPGGAGSEGAEFGGVEPGGAESEGAESRGVEPRLHEWLVPRARLWSGVTGAGGAGAGGTRGTMAAGPGGARTRGARAAGSGGVGGAGAGDPTEPGVAGAGGSCSGGSGAGGAGAGGAGVGGTCAGGAGAAGAGAVDPGAGGAGGTVRPRPYFVPLIQQPALQPASPLPAPFPYTEHSNGLTEHREPASRLVSPVCTARHAPRSRPPLVPATHAMALRPSSVPLRLPLLAPPESSLPEVPDPESDRARAASPTVSRLLATVVTDPSFESAIASALVAELLDFAAACM